MRVEERLDQSVWVRFRERYRTVRVCASQSKAPVPAPVRELRPSSPAQPQSTWMKGFSLHSSPPLWKIIQEERGTQGLGGGTGEAGGGR